jgi:hypothetical protein
VPELSISHCARAAPHAVKTTASSQIFIPNSVGPEAGVRRAASGPILLPRSLAPSLPASLNFSATVA